jgi:hypothetical protein
MDMPRRMFGKPKVAGEKEFFDLAKGQYETRQNLQAAGERYSQAVARSLKDALNGEDSSFTDVYAKKAKHADMIDDKDEGHFYVGSLRVIEQAKQDIAHFKGPAERVWDTLARYSALRKDIPDLDAKEVFGQYLKQRGEVFFAVLPLGLIGGGFAGAQDFNSPDTDLFNHKNFMYFGMSEKQIGQILGSPDPSSAQPRTPNTRKLNLDGRYARVETCNGSTGRARSAIPHARRDERTKRNANFYRSRERRKRDHDARRKSPVYCETQHRRLFSPH